MKAITNQEVAIDLTVFDDVSADTSSDDVAGNSETALTGETTGNDDSTQSSNEDVVYGIQDDDTTQEEASEIPEADENEQEMSFEELIKGKYKNDFSSKVQGIINERFKESKQNEARLEKFEQMAEVISAKYGLSGDNFDELMNAVQQDDSFYEEQAIEKGMTVGEYREHLRQQKEANKITQELEALRAEKQQQEYLNQWEKEANELKEEIPDFDFDVELQNDKFSNLVTMGWSLKDAYEAVHAREIINKVVPKAVEQAKVKTVQSIMAKGLRPNENGVKSHSPAKIKNSVDKLDDKDFDEIKRRVRNGDTGIKF